MESSTEEQPIPYNEQVLKLYLEAYNNKVKSKYIHQVKSNPEAFPLYNKNDLKLSFVFLNETFFRKNPIMLISDDRTAKEFYNYREENNETLSRDYLEYADDSYAYIKDILKPIDFESHIFVLDSISTINYEDHTLSDLSKNLIRNHGGHSAESHYTLF